MQVFGFMALGVSSVLAASAVLATSSELSTQCIADALSTDNPVSGPHSRPQSGPTLGLLEQLGGNPRSVIASFSDLNLRATTKKFSRSVPLPLNKPCTQEYINNAEFRISVNRAAGFPRRIRLNLGEQGHRYVLDETYRSEVDKLVENPETQIWSDLTELDFFNEKELKDISALARFPYLEKLNLGYTKVKDVSKLAGLNKLQVLSLKNTQVKDVSALAGLMNLQVLDLSYTKVVDVSALAGLINLRKLYLYGTQVHDITVLDGLNNLRIVR